MSCEGFRCSLPAKYGPKNSRLCTVCKFHADINMTKNVVYRCTAMRCRRVRATYGKLLERPTRCRIHKKKDMVRVDYKICVHSECFNEATYTRYSIDPVLCETHADTLSKKLPTLCRERGCFTKARMGIAFGPAVACAKHASEEMIDLRRKCSASNCMNKKYGRNNLCEMHYEIEKMSNSY